MFEVMRICTPRYFGAARLMSSNICIQCFLLTGLEKWGMHFLLRSNTFMFYGLWLNWGFFCQKALTLFVFYFCYISLKKKLKCKFNRLYNMYHIQFCIINNKFIHFEKKKIPYSICNKINYFPCVRYLF